MTEHVYVVTSVDPEGSREVVAVFDCEYAAVKRCDAIEDKFVPMLFKELIIKGVCEC